MYKECFEILQDVAYREDKIGSVTPVSNKATIASIAHWPKGNASVMEQSHAEVAEAVRDFGLIAPNVETPTGHGFCMYMTRQALNQVGYFDERYGVGYGEENDWCQQAIQSGFKHVITTETYVFHNDTSSFTSPEKQQLLKQNHAQLLNRFPHYNRDVAEYVKRDPLKLHRLLLTLRISEIRKKYDKTKTISYILHDDILNSDGGTQKHVKETAESIPQYGPYECLVLCPQTYTDPSKAWLYYLGRNHAWDLRIPLTYRQLLQLLPYILDRTDILHFHHGLGWPQEFLEIIYAVKDIRKIFTFHDFNSFCASPFLLYNNEHLCNHCDDPEYCKKCFRQSKTVDRAASMHFLTSFDCILTPSEDTKQWIQHIVKSPALTARIRVLPHQLDFAGIPFTQASAPEAGQKRIIFLGHGPVHKGIKLFNNAYHRLLQMGF
ncbi:MAG: glycosyltransferase, partial [Planctomycetota bacterium]